MHRALTFILAYVLLSVGAAGLVLIASIPHWPKTIIGWTVLFFASLPLVFLFEAVGHVLFSESIAKRLTVGTARPISAVRMLYAFVVMLLFLAAVIFVGSWVEGNVGGFFAKHFH